MKKIIFALLLSLSGCWLVAQCPTDITFSNQGQIDSFPINYPGCTQIFGNMTIAESDSATITHLDSLLQINYIKDLNVLHNAALTSLRGLDSLTSIGGNLSISNNASLTSLSGLDHLTSISGGLSFYNDPGLTSLAALGKLAFIGKNLDVANDSSLMSLSGLNNLTSIGGGLSVTNNVALTSLNGLDNLSSVGMDLSLFNNPSLTTLNGLNSLISAGGFYISTCPVLTSLSGLNHLTSVSKNFFIDNNPALTSLSGLGSLISVGGTLLVYINPALTNLNDLNNLTSVGGVLDLGYNDALTSLSGLANLTTIGGGLSVYYNSTLTSLSGLDNMDFSMIITGMLIVDNPKLFLCDVQSICDYLENNGFITVSGNASGCKSMSQIKTACMVSSVEVPYTEQEAIGVFPNPATNVVNLDIPKAYPIDYRIFDLSGQLIRRGNQTGGAIDIRPLPPGGYLLNVLGEDGLTFSASRFIKI